MVNLQILKHSSGLDPNASIVFDCDFETEKEAVEFLNKYSENWDDSDPDNPESDLYESKIKEIK